MDVIAHRGLTGPGRQENTLAAVDEALRQGADGVEVDVRLTADGVPVCSHDPTLHRTAGLDLAIARTPYAELAAIKVAGQQVVPALADVASCVADRGLLVVELKRDSASGVATALAAAAVLARSGLDATVSSFDPALLAATRRVDPGSRRALLTGPGAAAEQGVRLAAALGCRQAHLHVWDLTDPDVLVNRARLLGVEVVAWVAEADLSPRLAASGAAGVICDDVPGVLRAVRPAAGRPAPPRRRTAAPGRVA